MPKITLPAVRRLHTGDETQIAFELPLGMIEYVWHLVRGMHDKGIEFFHVTIDKPFRPRTTGRRSQNHRLNGYCQIIAMETGNEFDTVKMCVKRRAIKRGYSFETDFDGEVVPKSEARTSVEECHLLIEEVQQLADELGIILPEYEAEDESTK